MADDGGCALKAPPDAAAIKEQALPTVQVPAQWTARRRGRGGCGGQLAGNIRRRTTGGGGRRGHAHNADLRVGAARVEQAQLYAKLAGAKLYPSVDLLARGGASCRATDLASRGAS